MVVFLSASAFASFVLRALADFFSVQGSDGELY